MEPRDALLGELKNLPDDVKSRLSKATPDQRKIFVDGLAKRMNIINDSSGDNKINNDLKKTGLDINASDLKNGALSGVTGLSGRVNPQDVPGILMAGVNGLGFGAPKQLTDAAYTALSGYVPMQGSPVMDSMQAGVNLPNKTNLINAAISPVNLASNYKSNNVDMGQRSIYPEAVTNRGRVQSGAMELAGAAISANAPSALRNMVNEIPAVKNYRALSERLSQNRSMARKIEISLEGLDKSIQKIDSLSSELKSSLSKDSRDIGYRAAKSAKDATTTAFESAKSNYGDVIMSVRGERVPMSDATRILDNIIYEKGLNQKTILDDSEQAILDLRKRFDVKPIESGLTRTPDGVSAYTKTEVPNPGLDSSEIKTFKNIVRKALRDRPDLEATFYKDYGNVLEANGMSELSTVNQQYSKAYELAENAKNLKKTQFSQIASGKIGRDTQEFKDILNSEKPYGSNFAENASKRYESYVDSQKKLARARGILIDEKEINSRFLDYLAEQAKGHRENMAFYYGLKKKAIETGLVASIGSGIAATVGGLTYSAFKDHK